MKRYFFGIFFRICFRKRWAPGDKRKLVNKWLGLHKYACNFMPSLENIPLDLWDFEFQFSDLLDFLKFSESNIEYQRQTHIKHLNGIAKLNNIDSAEYIGELNNIESRFYIYLSRTIRYSVVISLAISVEWISKFLEDHATEKIQEKQKGSNKSIHILRTLLNRAEYLKFNNLDTLEKIIKLRNCMAHAMGSAKNYQHGDEIREIVKALKGFSLCDSHFINETINIDKGAIEIIICETQSWVTDFIEECRQKKLIEI